MKIRVNGIDVDLDSEQDIGSQIFASVVRDSANSLKTESEIPRQTGEKSPVKKGFRYFVIADTHFGHENIIKYCNRPFTSVKEMNEVMIKNWNETVSNNDTVIHLGDFCLGNKDMCKDITGKLNGKKILILGNHDNWSEQFYRDCGFNTVSKFPIIYNNFFMMSHAPLQLSETTPYFNFYGHAHNDMKYIDNATSKCVSVERVGYRPYCFMEKN